MSTNYIVPFSVLERWLGRHRSAGGDMVDIPYDDYVGLIRRLIEPVHVDETYYLERYPGVAAGIGRKHFRSGYHHFLTHGYFEGNQPFDPATRRAVLPIAIEDVLASTSVIAVRGGLIVRMKYQAVIDIVRKLLQSVPVDEIWYLKTYPGVAAAIEEGSSLSASAHYVQHGYEACWWPFNMQVDEGWYLMRYPDAGQAVLAQEVSSAQDHFSKIGYRQGRYPTKFPAR